ncbi:MAG: hypothetical protein AB1483_06215 [Candidatus Zixiibacteriota bacterium]
MRETIFNVSVLIRIQQIGWYLVLAYFLAITILYMLDFENVFAYTKYGIILILAVAIAQLIVMAEQFRLAKLKRFWLLSYFLVVVLAAVAALKLWL